MLKRSSLFCICFLFLSIVLSGEAEKARYVEDSSDSAYHAQHLQMHLNSTSLRCTGNYVKVKADSATDRAILGHLEQADTFMLLEIDGTQARIHVLFSASSSPDSYVELDGWVNTDYIECSCNDDAYYRNTSELPSFPDSSSASLESCIGTPNVVCTTNNLRIRNEPNGKNILGHLERADQFLLLDLKENWAYIQVIYAASTSPDSYVGLTGWVSADYIAPYGTPSISNAASWKQAYLSALQAKREYEDNLLYENYTYSLIYVNDDPIPELVVDRGSEAGGCLILTYCAGVVDELQTRRRAFTYLEMKNLLNNSDGRMDYYYDYIYTIKNGVWTCVATGESYSYLDDFKDSLGRYICQTYIWNGKETSMEDYLSALRQIYNEDQAIKPSLYYSADEILAFLNENE